MKKVYVSVTADISSEGEIIPLCFTWEDGRKFDIDRIIDIRPAASLRAGGNGIRYTVRVMGKQVFMFLESFFDVPSGYRWFMECL